MHVEKNRGRGMGGKLLPELPFKLAVQPPPNQLVIGVDMSRQNVTRMISMYK